MVRSLLAERMTSAKSAFDESLIRGREFIRMDLVDAANLTTPPIERATLKVAVVGQKVVLYPVAVVAAAETFLNLR